MRKISRLGIKIVIPSLLVVIIGITSIVAIILNLYTEAYTGVSSDYIETLTDDYAKQIESQMARTLTAAESLSFSIKSVMERPGASREEILSLVRVMLDNHEELVGIGVGFEPNAFDGKDSQYRSGTEHSDDAGRFVPYTYRENGVIDYTQLDGYDDPGDYGSWYNVPKRTNKTYVTTPYWYEVGTEKYLMFTCVAPLRNKQGQFVGITGFDTPVSTLNSIVQSVKVFDTGYLSLVAPDGTIAYHPDSAVMGTMAKDYFPQEVNGAVEQAYDSGTMLSLEASAGKGAPLSRYTLAPIEVGLSGGQWVVLTSVPLSEINKVNNDSVRTAVIIGIAIAALVAITLSLILSFTVLRPVKIIKSATDNMAKGSLDIHMPVKSKDEFGQLAKNVETTSKKMLFYVSNISKTLGEISNGNMAVTVDDNYIGDFVPIQNSMEQIIEYLNRTLLQISESATQFATGSRQVSDGAQSLAQGSTEQSSAVEQLSSYITAVSDKTTGNADLASRAASLAGTIKQSAEKGSLQMDQMMKAVEEISEASKSINKVIKVIDDIAFKTNILALNAAVEAARAGQHGKGFAVVADEVRNLAAKSAEAAKDTGSLITNSMEKSELGTRIASETAASLVDIVSGINESNQIVGDIAKSSVEQADAIARITNSIEQVAQVVQQNSATAEESAAASEEMSGSADMLHELISKFTLKNFETSKMLYDLSRKENGLSLSSLQPDKSSGKY